MIIDKLAQLYDRLVEEQAEGLPNFGFCLAKVSYALVLDAEGNLVAIETITDEGSKKLFKELVVLKQVGKNGDANCPSFLCDNTNYVLGRGLDFNPKDQGRFESFRAEQHRLGDTIDDAEMKAVLKFLDNWKPEELENSPLLFGFWPDICKSNGNIVFKAEVEGPTTKYVHQNKAIVNLFLKDFLEKDAERGLCSISGINDEPLARTHDNKIKGVMGGQSSGTSLVSYNASAFNSYNKEQGANAPVSNLVAFKYTASLNHLLKNRQRVLTMGDVTTVFWCDKADDIEDFFGEILNASIENENKLETYFDAINSYKNDADRHVNTLLNNKVNFYFLGLNPSGGRIGASLFIPSTPLKVGVNLKNHYVHSAIEANFSNKPKYIPLWQLNSCLKNKNAKGVPSNLVVALDESILTGRKYPTAVLLRLMNVIRGDKKVGYERASLLKAILIKNYGEKINMSLNTEIADEGYLLGRLFAVLEAIQDKAIGANASIADRYLGSAASTPSVVFPTLLRLTTHHLSKIGGGLAYNMEKEIQEVLNVFNNNKGFPKRLDLRAQGMFFIGYYQEKIAVWSRFGSEKKEVEGALENNE